MKAGNNIEESEHLNLTPMIDVVFLLLIFFMLAAKFTDHTTLEEILLPCAANSIEDESLQLVINVNKQGHYIINGIKYPETSLHSLLHERISLKSAAFLKVKIRADRFTPYTKIQNLFAVFSKAGVFNISFAVKQALS